MSSPLLTPEQAEELRAAAGEKVEPVKHGKARKGTKIKLGRVGDELHLDDHPSDFEDEEDYDVDAHMKAAAGDDAPVSSRSAREAAIAARLGIATNMDNVAPHVAGSLVGFGRAGHSPERAWAAAGGGDGSPAPFGATTADAPGGGGRVTLPQYKERCAEVLREFFTSGDYDEIRRCYKELGSPFFGWEFVRRLLMLAMERSEPQREAASRLLSVMYAAELSMEQIGKGFERLYETIDDFVVDVPSARSMAAKFTARAVADEVLPPGFLTDPVVASLAGDIAEQAKTLLSLRRSHERLEHCWGVNSTFSLPELKAATLTALKEYYVSFDAAECGRCLSELRAPHFGHEAVYRALLLAIDVAPSTALADKCLQLLTHLQAGGVVSERQLSEGFDRMHTALPDARVDNPHADATYAYLVGAAVERGLLPAAWVATALTAAPGAAPPKAKTHPQPSSTTAAATTTTTSAAAARPGAAGGGATPVEPAKPTHADASPLQIAP